ncbi:MAG: UDP-3-O-(3-hydroxymyristoyl)glucosamine N-acyltransferase [Pseudomonadota bacterium]
MADPRFFITFDAVSATQIAQLVGAELTRGSDAARASHAAGLDADALAGGVAFIESERALARLLELIGRGASPSVLIATPALASTLTSKGGAPEAMALLTCSAPRAAFARVAAALHMSRAEAPDLVYAAPGEAEADIAADAHLDVSARIGPGASIGAGAVIRPNVVIGPGAVIGAGARIEAGAVVTHAYVGEAAIIGANAVVGGAGFGVVEMDGRPTRIPQLGVVRIGDRVEVGAGVGVDRATLGETSIGDDTKIDNLCQVAHNVRIGEGCVIAAHCGIAGSAWIGDGVVIGGHSGIGDHVRIGDGARLGSMSGFMRDVPPGESWGGLPAMPTHLWWRSILFMQRASKPKTKQANGD